MTTQAEQDMTVAGVKEIIEGNRERLEREHDHQARVTRRRVPLTDRVKPFSAIENNPPDPGDLLLGPLVVKGHRTVIGGHTGHGKSTAALQMLAAACGYTDAFLGWKGAAKVGLVIDGEQSDRTIYRRLEELDLLRADSIHFCGVPEGIRLDDPLAPELAEIEEMIEMYHPDIVLLDPLYKMHSGDPNDEQIASQVMAVVDEWRAHYGFALIIPAHTRKPPNSAAEHPRMTMHDISGSASWVRGAEVILGVQRTEPGEARWYWWKDRDGDLPVGETWALVFDRDLGGFARSADELSIEEFDARTTRAGIIDYLTRHAGHWHTGEQITAALNLKAATVARTLKRMLADAEAGKLAIPFETAKLKGRRVYSVGVPDEEEDF